MKQIYCIYDKIAGFYNNELIILDNDTSAKRWLHCFHESVCETNPNSPFSLYPEDFDLYCVGTFDNIDCITAVYDKPRFVVNASFAVNTNGLSEV